MQAKRKNKVVFLSIILTIATLILGTVIIKYTISKVNHSYKNGFFVLQGVNQDYATARDLYKAL